MTTPIPGEAPTEEKKPNGRKWQSAQQVLAFNILLTIASFALAMNRRLTADWVQYSTIVLGSMTAVAMSFMGTNAWVSSKTEPLVIQAKAAQAARDDR